jgi:hypothetical protein
MPKVTPGSLFSTSEGWFTSITTYMMSDLIAGSEDWRVQSAGALALAVIVGAYVVMRAKVKMAEASKETL